MTTPLPGAREVSGMLVVGAVASGLTQNPLYIGLAGPTALIYLLVQKDEGEHRDMTANGEGPDT